MGSRAATQGCACACEAGVDWWREGCADLQRGREVASWSSSGADASMRGAFSAARAGRLADASCAVLLTRRADAVSEPAIPHDQPADSTTPIFKLVV